MTTALTTAPSADMIERVVMAGDLKDLTPAQRVTYYRSVCESIGLNPLTQPFLYVTLNGKLTLYARKDATDQLRKRDKVSVTIVAREVVEGVYVVTARATTPDGRTDESIGAVPIERTQGEARANAYMKAESKAKRRVTLSICGLGMLDETEISSIPGARMAAVDQTTGEILDGDSPPSPPPPPPQIETIIGAAGSIKQWEHEGDARLVFRLGDTLVIAKSALAEQWHDIADGEPVEVVGTWADHPKQGRYLAAQTIRGQLAPAGKRRSIEEATLPL